MKGLLGGLLLIMLKEDRCPRQRVHAETHKLVVSLLQKKDGYSCVELRAIYGHGLSLGFAEPELVRLLLQRMCQ